MWLKTLSKSEPESGKLFVFAGNWKMKIDRRSEIQKYRNVHQCALEKLKIGSQLFCPCSSSSSTILQQLSVQHSNAFTTVCYPVIYMAKGNNWAFSFLFDRLLG